MTRTIVITGGTGGLGSALVRRLLRFDTRLAITYLLPDEASRFEHEFGVDEERFMLRRVDATNAESITSFMKHVANEWGPISGLASLVGGWAGGRDIDETDDLRFDRMIDLNLRSSFYTVRAAIPHMREADFGRIVLVGSRAGIENPAGQAAFNMAKAGVMALGMSTASELEDTNVTVSVLVPSVIDTPATRATLPYSDYVDWPTPDEIAGVAEFLLSEEAGVMNGALVPVFGRS
ncbi:MAG: SDR family NAD(P)-dependent oxidoreductase [Acidimicrobiia bacterium]|nr:SDR family NAD(P)-dependent oxidoreductase [Acidimicrobiia bacterium]MDH4307066.1 SDR family NAD(P)-dependent oxidoreductase [Acidimicrobiia bacterium]MDH5292760.1 SDR family NAD(P)-dependent oxidoreductase [Acidimicrobiia bacterium]